MDSAPWGDVLMAAPLDPEHHEHVGSDTEAGIRREPPALGQPALQVIGDTE